MRRFFRSSAVLQHELEETGFIHRPLPLHRENSTEHRARGKKILKSRVLWDCRNADGWISKGPGTLTHEGRLTPDGNTSLRTKMPTTSGHWPETQPDGDYTPYFREYVSFDTGLHAADISEYNRIVLRIFPDCPGARVITLAFVFAETHHYELILENRRWNECFLEIPDSPCGSTFRFEIPAFGKDRSTGDYLCFDIGEIQLEKIADPETDHGWLPEIGRVAYSYSGYEKTGAKTAIIRADENSGTHTARQTFSVKNAQSEILVNGNTKRIECRFGAFDVIDFSTLKPDDPCPADEQQYTIQCGNSVTRPFRITDSVFADSLWRALNFIFCERCGYPVSGKHGICHGDILAEHKGLTLVYNGGWHDAGDLSQQTLQSADVVFNLLELAEQVKETEHALYVRLTEEAEWGLDFILKCRFGDGYRASSAGLVDWTDGFIGNMDDRPARVQNNAFDNFLYAAYEAFASLTLTYDSALSEKLRAVAIEDFGFALDVYKKIGFAEKPVFWEHSYSTSPSLYMAALSWSASMLFQLTGKNEYAEHAVDAMNYVLMCQCDKPIGEKQIQGFFYRDSEKKVIQHFNHQSREQLFMQALSLLIRTQGQHPNLPLWQHSMELYAGYIKNIASFTAPWGMLPSGVYHIDEKDDKESFDRQHLFPGENAENDFTAQVTAGEKIDDKHYVRIFPVWFSFRGNAAVHLSSGKAAAICGALLGDEKLLEIAREQFYWLLGKNPFCQSLMYGEGYNYPEQSVFLPGTMTGSLPVGIKTKDNEDVPYWPAENNATYKEAWVTVAGKWLSLAAELESGEKKIA